MRGGAAGRARGRGGLLQLGRQLVALYVELVEICREGHWSNAVAREGANAQKNAAGERAEDGEGEASGNPTRACTHRHPPGRCRATGAARPERIGSRPNALPPPRGPSPVESEAGLSREEPLVSARCPRLLLASLLDSASLAATDTPHRRDEG
eukprot:4048318-Prymnesium_polylepis.2